MGKIQILAAVMAVVVLGVGAGLFFGKGMAGRVAAAEDAPLVNSYWALTAIGDDAFTMPEGMAREPHFVLHLDDNRVAGYAGCNRMTGIYTLEGDKISFGEGMAMTRMACAAGMDVEQQFADILTRTALWRVSGETLTLLDANGTPVGTFERRLME